MPPAVSFIIRGTIRFSISTTVRLTPLDASASRMIEPMKPAPIRSTERPGSQTFTISRASARVQQLCTPALSIPGIGGLIGLAPVAINSLS